jgi:hypothetical protein
MSVCEFDWSLFGNLLSGIGSIIAAIFTIMLFSLARHELKRNNQIAEGDLYFRIKEDFDTDISRAIHSCVVHNQIKFDKSSTPESVNATGTSYSITHFTNAYLGSFEDLAFFHDKGLMSLEVLDSGFGYMILETGNNETICNIIQHLRAGKENDDSIYSGFETLYKKIRATLTDEQKKLFREDFSPTSQNTP